MSSKAPEELCLGLGQPDGSYNKKEGPFQKIALLPNSPKFPFLVQTSDELHSPGTNLYKSISVKARITFFTQAF